MLSYLYKNWAFMGLGIAFYTTLLLFSSYAILPYFIFLVWLQFPVYLLHEFEEHAFPGGFQHMINKKIFGSIQDNVLLNEERIFWINIGAIWILFPLFAVLAQTVNPAFGVLLPCFGLFNATTHIIAAVVKRMYNPGLLISIFLNYPTGLYTLKVAQQQGYLTTFSLWGSFIFAAVIHIMMIFYIIFWHKRTLKQT